MNFDRRGSPGNRAAWPSVDGSGMRPLLRDERHAVTPSEAHLGRRASAIDHPRWLAGEAYAGGRDGERPKATTQVCNTHPLGPCAFEARLEAGIWAPKEGAVVDGGLPEGVASAVACPHQG